MKIKLIIIVILVICLFISVFYIISERNTYDFSKCIEKENIDDLTLTVYYMNPEILTLMAWDVDMLMSSENTSKIVVKGKDLEKNLDLFLKMKGDVLKPVYKNAYINARIYYVLESAKNGKIFDVIMNDYRYDEEVVFVNGKAFKYNQIFYEAIKPFLG